MTYNETLVKIRSSLLLHLILKNDKIITTKLQIIQTKII